MSVHVSRVILAPAALVFAVGVAATIGAGAPRDDSPASADNESENAPAHAMTLSLRLDGVASLGAGTMPSIATGNGDLVYVAWGAAHRQLVIATSTDGGATFGARETITTPGERAAIGNTRGSTIDARRTLPSGRAPDRRLSCPTLVAGASAEASFAQDCPPVRLRGLPNAAPHTGIGVWRQYCGNLVLKKTRIC